MIRAILVVFMQVVCVFGMGQVPARATMPQNVTIIYGAPQHADYQVIYETLKDARILEDFQQILGLYALNKALTLQLKDCDRTDNAWYNEANYTVTVCYEYLANLARQAPTETTTTGVTPKDAVVGPTAEIFLHEIAHALFHIMQIPVLGNEEDAADMVAAYTLLQLGPKFARGAIAGLAYMYQHDKEDNSLATERMSDAHPLAKQRYYNLLCLAYGADPVTFAYVVDRGDLPEDRAMDCDYEYERVNYAVKTLLQAHMDIAERKRAYTHLKSKLSGNTLYPSTNQ